MTLHLMLKKALLACMIVIMLMAFVYPFIEQSTPNANATQQADKPTTSSIFSDELNQALDVEVLAAGIDPFAPEFEDNYPTPEFAAILDIKTKKQVFFAFIKHFADQNNTLLLKKREFVQSIQQQLHTLEQDLAPSDTLDSMLWADFVSQHLTASQTKKLDFLVAEYRITESLALAVIDRLLLRINTIPVELIQVQTANESGWGTSRFAIQGHNYFGLWCYRKGCGFVPSQRDSGASHEVAKFSSPAEGMYQYVRNLNRNRAYRQLRKTRESMPSGSDSFTDAMLLTQTLGAYSQRGDDYIAELQSMLRVNKPYF